MKRVEMTEGDGGFTRFPNAIYDQDFLAEIVRRCGIVAAVIWTVLWRFSEGWGSNTASVSISSLSRITGISHPAIKKALKRLIHESIIGVQEKRNGFTPIYEIPRPIEILKRWDRDLLEPGIGKNPVSEKTETGISENQGGI